MPTEYPVLGDRPIDQWKVTELKDELRRRKLPIKGLKDDLVKRLFDAITTDSELQKEDELDNGLNPDSLEEDSASEFPNADNEVQAEEAAETPDNRTEHGESGMIDNDIVADAGKDDLVGSSHVRPVVEEPVSLSTSVETSSTRADTHVTNDDLIGSSHVRPVVEEPVSLLTSVETSSTDLNLPKVSSGPSIEAHISENNEDAKTPAHESDVQENVGDPITKPATKTHDKEDEDPKSAIQDTTIDEPKSAPENKPDSNNQEMATQIDALNDSLDNVEKEDTEVLFEDVSKSQYDSNNQVFEAKPDIGLQVSYESISTNSISVSEKNELNNNINISTDNLNLELKVVKPEMVLPSSSETTIGGDSQTSEDVIKHDENQFPSIEDSGLEKTSERESEMKIDITDGGYPEKINLDRSSGDESMEEDVLESKTEDNSTLMEDKASSLFTMTTEEAAQHDGRVTESSVPENAALEEEAKPVIPSEKRKLSGMDPGAAEPAKRQRRWSTDTAKIPERQYSNISIPDTPKDPLFPKDPKLPTHKRVIARSDSTVKADGEKERTVPQSSRPPTTSLRIDRFLRPFTLKAVQELLSKTGTICSFWMDNIKTHCYVTFSSEEEATATRNAVYNLQWPHNGGRLLVAEFVDPQEVKMRVEAPPESPAPVTPSPKAPSVSLQQPQAAPQQPSRQLGSRQQPSTLPLLSAPPLLPAPPVQLNPPPRERLVAPPPAPKEPDPPILTLDDLFMKTKATPRIYYLPLSEEQVAAKRANQLKSARS